MLREIWYAFAEFLRTFGALQLFFIRLLANTPSIFTRRGGLVIKQVYNAGGFQLAQLHQQVACQYKNDPEITEKVM